MIKINTNVCASITDDNLEDIIKTVNKIKNEDIDYIELRLDLIEDVDSALAKELIGQIKHLTDKRVILTNRTKLEGGFFEGSEAERIQILVDNAGLVDIVDVELFTDKQLRQRVIDASNKTIISYHNFSQTLDIDALQKIIDEASKIGDISKIAVKPNSLEDTYVVLKLLMDNDDLVAISMDNIGSYTRIISPILGSPITYASVGESSAPGQLDIERTISMIKELKQD
ncbi:MAG: type I 3-dehydroquinate dehydratase [Methanosphaera sp.]|nr:type I 3-dehydroquinate dehydratase [Methanosphaera sp.]